MLYTRMANQWEAKNHIIYCGTAKSHIKLMGTHNKYSQLFLFQGNIVLNPSEVDIYKKPTLQYE